MSMKRTLCIAIVVFLFCAGMKAQNKNAPVNFDEGYQTATFTDPARGQKITQAFAVIDKIFKDYAKWSLMENWYRKEILAIRILKKRYQSRHHHYSVLPV